MNVMSLTRFLIFALSFIFISSNCYGQASNNFLLIYEDYQELANIEEIIQTADEKIYKKYGVNQEKLNEKNPLNSQRFFIGYQVRNFGGTKLIELKFNKQRIEKFFIDNSIPFLANQSSIKVYVAINDAFFPLNNLLVFESLEFQNEIEVAKLLGNLNQNVDIDFELLSNYPFDIEEENSLIDSLENRHQDNWSLMLIDRFDLDKWSIKFPKSKEISISEGLNFESILSRNLFYSAKEQATLAKSLHVTKFNFDIPKIQVTNLLEIFSSSSEILSFYVSSVASDYIEITYESYLAESEVLKLLSDKGFNFER